MYRWSLAFLSVAIAIFSVGCCGPMGCGTTHCYDCDGVGYGERMIPRRPLDRLRQAKKRLVCGSGCGEVYRDEWISTPPDCNDPCCENQFVGGATPSRPGCWQPGNLARRLFAGRRLYGGRLCTGDESTASCGSDAASCEEGFLSAEPMASHQSGIELNHAPIYNQPVVNGGSNCGCARATPLRGHITQRSAARTQPVASKKLKR